MRHPQASVLVGSAWMTGTRPVRTRERGSALWRSPCKSAEVYSCTPFRGSSWPGLSRPPPQPRHAAFAPPPSVCACWVGVDDRNKSGQDAREGFGMVATPPTTIREVRRDSFARDAVLAQALNFDGRRRVDLVDRLRQRRVELGFAHVVPEIADQSAREAGDHPVIGGKASAGVGPRIAARKRHDPGNPIVTDQVRIEVGHCREW